MFWMRSTNMLLHGAVSFLLLSRRLCQLVPSAGAGGPARGPGKVDLTPMQRFLQLEPSWFRKGQTTSLVASAIEKDEVSEDRGGILKTPPHAVEGFWGGGAGAGTGDSW